MFHPPIQQHRLHDTRLRQNVWCCSNDQDMIQFRTDRDEEEDNNSGFCSPPLWNNNSTSTPSSPSSSQPLLTHHVSTSLSPRSRLQAITRGQRELMDMVKTLPELSYELSLQDLVEHRHRMEFDPQSQPQPQPQPAPLGQQGLSNRKGQGGIKKNIRRSGSFEVENTGLFLKMGFPFSVRSRRRNKVGGSGSGRVSPKPEGVKGGSGDRDWWKKKFTGSSDSDSSRASINSSSTGGSSHSYGSNRNNNRWHLSRGCWPLFQSRGNKYVN